MKREYIAPQTITDVAIKALNTFMLGLSDNEVDESEAKKKQEESSWDVFGE